MAEESRTTVERKSDRELVVTRTFDAPARLVFEAWSKPELFRQWWLPKSMNMVLHDCEMDVRTGGKYRLNFGGGMDFYGRYLEVVPPSRIVWKRSSCFEPVSEYSDPFWTPRAWASASIEVPWKPRSAKRRAASRVSSSLRVATSDCSGESACSPGAPAPSRRR